MLIITWDEHGGFFDHVKPPPAARIPTGSPPKDIQGRITASCSINMGRAFQRW